MNKIEILTKDYNISEKYMDVKINFRYDGQIYEYDRRDSNCELDNVELFTKIKDEKQNTVYNFTIYNGIGSYEYTMKMDKNLINEAFFDKLKEEGLIDQITDYKDYDEIINKKEDYKIEFTRNNYKNKNCNGKMIEEYDFKFIYKNHAYGVYITNEINKDYSEKTAHLLQYNNDYSKYRPISKLTSKTNYKENKNLILKQIDEKVIVNKNLFTEDLMEILNTKFNFHIDQKMIDEKKNKTIEIEIDKNNLNMIKLNLYGKNYILEKKNNKYEIGLVNLFGQEKIIYESEKMGVVGDEIEVCKFNGKELGKELWGTICSDKQLKLFVNERSYEDLKRNGKDLMREGCDGKVWEERMWLWGLFLDFLIKINLHKFVK